VDGLSNDHAKLIRVSACQRLSSVMAPRSRIAGYVILPQPRLHSHAEAPPNKIHNKRCGPRTVIASTRQRSQNKCWEIRGFKRNGVYIFKGVPLVPQPLAPGVHSFQFSQHQIGLRYFDGLAYYLAGASEARKAITFTHSMGVPMRPRESWRRNCAKLRT